MSKHIIQKFLETTFAGTSDAASKHLNKRIVDAIPSAIDSSIEKVLEIYKAYEEYLSNGKKLQVEILLDKKRKSQPNQVKLLDDSFNQYNANKSDKKIQIELIRMIILSSIYAVETKKLTTLCDNDNVEVPDDLFVWQPLTEMLTSERIIESFNLILENNISFLDDIDEKLLASFSEIINHNLILDGQYVPIDNLRFRAALLK